MRFDDTLETVLAGDLGTPFGMQSAWRQLVDLIGRRKAPPDMRALAVLRRIRAEVPPPVRQASARGLEVAHPPAPLVRLFAVDELPVALPVLRSARLQSADWIELLPDLSPAARSVLRNRRDLSPAVRRALESYGPVDFVLPDGRDPGANDDAGEADLLNGNVVEAETAFELEADANPAAEDPVVEAPVAESPVVPEMAPAASGMPVPERAEVEDFSFAALGGFATALPNVTVLDLPEDQSGTDAPPVAPEAIAQAVEADQSPGMLHMDALLAERTIVPETAPEAAEVHEGPYEIADVVARIDAFWRSRDGEQAVPRAAKRSDEFRFETDARGVIRWVDGVSRAPLVGLSLDQAGFAGGPRVDGIASGAFRQRAGFSNARLAVGGDSDAAGDWLISAVPAFDSVNGRFTGYRGAARRPRTDERAEPARPVPSHAADSLRQLVHELRTPTNAIAGFAEMIEAQMLGPVADPYRERAGVIRVQARELLGAIDDLDLAARVDSAALSLVPARIALRPLLAGIADDLGPLCELRGAWIALPVDDFAVDADRRAVERLLARLMATLVSASGPGERIGVHAALDGDGKVALTIDRPAALADYPGDSVLGIDDEGGDATLLGTGFALRLARNLARELGGSMAIDAESLTLRLPASENRPMGQAHLS